MFQVERNSPGVKSWHEGEIKLQKLLNFHNEIKDDFEIIRSYLPESQRIFHTSNISFLPITTLEPNGRVWVSILVGPDSYPGFVSSSNDTTLKIEAKTWIGDPIRQNLLDESSNNLFAGVGVELWSRRRNKLAGKTKSVEWMGDQLELEVEVNQTCGNCPKYISIRRLTAAPASSIPILSPLTNKYFSSSDVLPPTIISFIHSCDTVFFGTSFIPSTKDPNYPPHLGCNHRGGSPGFIRVTLDGKKLILPDLSGNRFLTSLGNVETDQHVGLVLPDFKTGSILYVTGLGINHVGEEAKKIMLRTNLLTEIQVTGFIFVENALPFREAPGTLESSPYSPPIKYLTTEANQPMIQNNVGIKLIGIEMHSNNLATFKFETSKPIQYKSGQYAILDLKELLGDIGYVHLSKGDEKSPNEDGVRTWTISSASPNNESTNIFSLTIQQIHRGRITTLLYTYARQFLSTSSSSLPVLELNLLGIGGDFLLPQSSPAACDMNEVIEIVYIAGGIGITPLLSFLSSTTHQKFKIKLILSTKAPEVLIKLIQYSIIQNSNIELSVHLFSTAGSDPNTSKEIEESKIKQLKVLKGRINLMEFHEELKGNLIYLCGPSLFEENMIEQLKNLGVEEENVKRESFKF